MKRSPCELVTAKNQQAHEADEVNPDDVFKFFVRCVVTSVYALNKMICESPNGVPTAAD